MIEHVLAVVPVSDMARATRFYEQLFGRPPDNRPMATLVEWRLTGSGWLQVFSGTGDAGGASVNLAVDDLGGWIDQVRSRGLTPGDVQEADKGVRLSAVTDPDGNTVTAIGGFRVEY
jgi:catechol 2,3-dioxygenase-like lactoylglutathione lyase family enzyme